MIACYEYYQCTYSFSVTGISNCLHAPTSTVFTERPSAHNTLILDKSRPDAQQQSKAGDLHLPGTLGDPAQTHFNRLGLLENGGQKERRMTQCLPIYVRFVA